ncbi:unnamed protein product [Staurois parvus]|uniref:Secreted protein n=1 Tax=Staurois parvus TaxID=386267 RepID=A0ABN9EQ30_9NEOB|nr:unnamed protein product [Staurois parvus]
MLTPSCPVPLVVSVLFISTDHCIGVTGDVSDTKSIPPSVRMPAADPQSCYKSLITTITRKKNYIIVYIPPFVNNTTFT